MRPFKSRLGATFLAFVIAILFSSMGTAYATPQTVPDPSPNIASSDSASHSDSDADSSSESVSGATSGSSSTSGATGGTANGGKQKQRQGQGQGQSLTNDSNDRNKYIAVALPGPAWTPPMAKVECSSPKIENRSMSVGWGLFSVARGDTFTDDCFDFTMVNHLIDQCQYEDAANLRDEVIVKRHPGYKPGKRAKEIFNYDSKLCADTKRLQAFGPPPPAPVTNNYITNTYAAPVACAAPVAPPKKRVVIAKKPAPTCAK